MNIGNITSNNFNLDNNGKDMQIEVYEQLIEQLQQKIDKTIENWNILKRHFEFLKINTTGGNKEFMEDILGIMNTLDGGEKDK